MSVYIYIDYKYKELNVYIHIYTCAGVCARISMYSVSKSSSRSETGWPGSVAGFQVLDQLEPMPIILGRYMMDRLWLIEKGHGHFLIGRDGQRAGGGSSGCDTPLRSWNTNSEARCKNSQTFGRAESWCRYWPISCFHAGGWESWKSWSAALAC